MFQVIGGVPIELHDALHEVSHMLYADVVLPTVPMDPPNMVMTTSAVIRITMAATTTVRVIFIFFTLCYWSAATYYIVITATCIKKFSALLYSTVYVYFPR